MPRRTCISALVLGLSLVLGAACIRAEVDGNLLGGRDPAHVQGVRDVARVTDGSATRPGDEWNTEYTAVFASRTGSVAWDLGVPTTVRFLYVQGDNNDAYDVEVSYDGEAYRRLWTAEAIAEPGMQARYAEVPETAARWLRVRARGGDGAYSLSEVAAFSEKPAAWPPHFRIVSAHPGMPARTAIAVFGMLAGIFVMGYRPDRRAMLLLPLGAIAALASWLVPAFPPRTYDVSLFKAVLALLAGVVLFRTWRGTGAGRLDGKTSTAILAAIAVLSAAAYAEFGRLEFRNEKAAGRPTFVHTWDSRHYFPLAKYFPELHFDGLYFASVAAWLDDMGGVVPAEQLAKVRIRDLRNNQVTTVDKVQDAVEQVKARFTPERWEVFRADMRWFRETMGRQYLGSMIDHGGNATPAWILGAWALYANIPASELALSLTALIDPLLLALLSVCIARTFGTRAMLLSVILFGVTDFGRFGATLIGATLRYDWLVALGLGVCALRTQRWALGGALIAYAGLIRAFPAVALVFLSVPVLFEAVRIVRQTGRLPELREIEGAVPFLRVVAGASATVLVLVGLSVALFSWDAGWGAWLEKIVPHADKPNVNHVGLRTVIAYESQNVASRVIDWSNPEPWWRWQQTQMAAWQTRRPIYLLAAAALIGLAAWAARRRRLDQAALLGMLIIPALFYPANYYYHYILLLPLVAVGTREEGDTVQPTFAIVSLALLGLCAAQYLTLGTRWMDERFTWQTWLLLGAFVSTAGAMIWSALRPENDAARAPALR